MSPAFLRAAIGVVPSRIVRQDPEGQEEDHEMPRAYRQPLAVAVTCLAIMMACMPLPVTALQIGDKAPDFLVFSTMGESLRLSDYQGKKHVLLFFFWRAFGGV
jgi:AhpC/TSA family